MWKTFQNRSDRSYKNKLILVKTDSHTSFLRRVLPISWIKHCRNDSHNNSGVFFLVFFPFIVCQLPHSNTSSMEDLGLFVIINNTSASVKSERSCCRSAVTLWAATIMPHSNNKAFGFFCGAAQWGTHLFQCFWSFLFFVFFLSSIDQPCHCHVHFTK